MKGQSLIVLLAMQLVVFSFSRNATAAQAPQAESLFRQALAADQSGDHAQRDQLLNKALQVDPDYRLARWYLGQVHYDGQWKSVDAVSRLVSSDPRWQEYRDRLADSGGDLESQAELARWCGKHGLIYEQRWHWLQVLSIDSTNREALGRLGLRHYQGMLLSDKQVAAYERQTKNARADFERYSKQFQNWIRTAATGDDAARAKIVKKVSRVRELAAIPALMECMFDSEKNEILLRDKLDAKSEKFLVQLHLAVVSALGEISDHDATLALLDIAVFSPEAKVYPAAAKALQYREKTGYVPLLMEALAEPLELDYSVNVLSNGKVKVHEDLTEKLPLEERTINRSSSFHTQHVFYVSRDIPGTANWGRGQNLRLTRVGRTLSERAKDYAHATGQLERTQELVDSENAEREARNKRIEEVLRIATSEDYGDRPSDWWDGWKKYNELETPEQLPKYEQVETRNYERSYIYEYAYPRSAPSGYSRPPRTDPRYWSRSRSRSCFVAGTPVWTQVGLVPIEGIQVGDMVLSQDPATGELDYRPVIDKTVRAPSPTVKLGIGGDQIIATRGHRFWVTGKGWSMAKFLSPGSHLWSLAGEVNLDTAQPSRDYEAFNLEVGQFHTYFVGEHQLLVHDNSCPQPVVRSLPGVADTP